uniref:LOW QUALITY PROTEIN: lymphoid-restricted membrane protein-like n=1 Tax=Monopterus albus TaxID=43700 RepID=UPI0009B3BE85|nr:LOW QUALITY PROTEIN: lymphoid-restricted membrane protein-like [Monopterus albus]
MECYTPQANRRHNPVDSICRKLQSIQWRGDREPNSPFQIPKFSSSSYDSPQCGLRNNLEAILKRGALNRDEGEMGRERGNEKKGKGMAMPRSSASQSSLSPSIPLPTLSTPTCNYSTPANVTYTITSTFGERRGADGSDLRQVKTWQRNCSTPAGGSKDSPLFTFTQGPQSVQPESERPSRSLPLSQTFTPSHTTLFYNFNFQSVDTTNSTECELPSPALVVKRLAVGDGGTSMAFENKQNMAEISLICEENLLDTIFHACDTQRRGKVYVSHIVDYLRHTTSRSSEDSGLEELCNMLDPERKDVSIDLDTYHAVMREWIDDCRNNGKETEDDVTHDSVKLRDSLSAKRSMQLNMTSGSLEAFGGEVSRAEFETSELVYCVADLQMSNQKLQEEVKKFKQVVEAMEDSNQKLAEENEQLRNQARVNQQLAQKEKMLKEEVEEMKATLSCTEEGRAYASAHSKHVVSQDQAAHRGSIKTHSASPGVDRLSTTMSFATLLDETLDREVLLMLQGPSPERMALEFRCLLNKLKSDFGEETAFVLSTVKDYHAQPGGNMDTSLQTVQDKLETRRAEWALILDQLAQYTDSLEKELIKIASNMRRSRTEILHLSVKVQEQENQNRQLCEELDQLKTPQHSREASCQTPAPEEEPGDDLDWDEELAVQDFLKDKLAEKICWVQDRQTESKPEETANRLIDTGEEDDGEENWTVADTAGEGQVRDTSTPLSPLFGQAEPGQERTVEEGHDYAAHTESKPQVNCQPLQEEAAVPLSAHSQAVSIRCPEPEKNNAETCETTSSHCSGPTQNMSTSPEQYQTIAPNNLLMTAERVSPDSTSHGPDEAIFQSESTLLTSEDYRGAEQKEVQVETSPADMSRAKSLSQNQSTDKSTAEDCIRLLPVLVEEEESVQDSTAEAPPEAAIMPGTDQLNSSRATTFSNSSLPPSGSSFTHNSQSRSGTSSVTSDPTQLEDRDKKDPLLLGKNKRELGSEVKREQEGEEQQREAIKFIRTLQELSHTMVAIQEHKVQDPRETNVTADKESEISMVSGTSDTFKEDGNSLSPSDKEIEAEFQRLALGFKCDMFTLEKRLRLEERSRDLAEENIRREVSSCQGLLQALIPLCEDDNQSMEIIQRLQKNLDILIQSMTRVSSRSEMLGAIHQENRIGKAVEVMIQHVENLKRMYTKEHAELLELRETLMQNERSFGSQTERDDFRGKKQLSSQYCKSSVRRVSIAAIPRSGGSSMHFEMSKTHDGSEAETERLTKRSPWSVAGKSMARPPLKRFISSAAWVDTDEPSLMMKGAHRMACDSTDCQSEDKQDEPVAERRRSSLSELGNKLTSFILPLKTSHEELFVVLPSPSSSPVPIDPGMAQSGSHSLTSSRACHSSGSGRGLWLWVAMVVVLAGLLALLASLVMQPAVDAAHVGTGDSWMTIQQLLWPYTGLRHHGQPPV